MNLVRSFPAGSDEAKNESNSPEHHFSTKSELSSDEPKLICRTPSNGSVNDTKYFSINEHVDLSTDRTINFEQSNQKPNHQDSSTTTGFDPFNSNSEIDPFNSNIPSESLGKEFLKEDDPFSSGFFNINSKFEENTSSGDCKPFFTSRTVDETHDPIKEVDYDESGVGEFENLEDSEIRSMDSNVTFLESVDLDERCIFTRKSGQLENIPENDLESSDDFVYIIGDESTDVEKKVVDREEDNQADIVLKPIEEIPDSDLVNDEAVNREQANDFADNQQKDDPEKVDNALESRQMTEKLIKVQESNEKIVESESILKWRLVNELKIKNKDNDEMKMKDELLEQAKKEREDWYERYKQQLSKLKKVNRTFEEELIDELQKNETSKSWVRVVEMCDFKHSSKMKDTTILRSVLLELKNSTTHATGNADECIATTSSSTGEQAIYSFPSKIDCSEIKSSTISTKTPLPTNPESNGTISSHREFIETIFSSLNELTHYSTLPTRKTQHKAKANFNYEEPASIERPRHEQSNNHFVHTSYPVTRSSQSININSGPVDSMNEIGLPITNIKKANHGNHMNNQTDRQFDNLNLLNIVNCTLPRSHRDRHQSTANVYLNGAQSMSITKLNATILQTKFNRIYNNSCSNLSFNTSNNREFSASSRQTSSSLSNSSNNVILNTNLNSHSVVVSEDQIESLSSQLVVKPLPVTRATTKQLPKRTPPVPPVGQQHGFIKKWSTTNPTSITGNTLITTQLNDLPVIQEHRLVEIINQSERTSSATPSLGSSIEIRANDTNEKEDRTNLISMQTFTSSNNSLNTMTQTNLNSSNSASLISATSISSTVSSNDTQLTRTSLNHHNRPDVIINPIETIKQLKQKQRELKLKEKMLKKAEEQSVDDVRPKIIEEKLKTSTPADKRRVSIDKLDRDELMKNNANKISNDLLLTKLNNSVSLSSLISRTTNNGELDKKQIKSTNQQLLPAYRSQPNLHRAQMNSSNGDTCSNASTPDQLNRFEQLNQINHLNQLNKLNQSPSSQYSPSINDTDSSSAMNSVEMDNCVEFNSLIGSSNVKGQIKHSQKRPPQSSLKDTESQSNLKQKSVSFDPNVIEKENSKAPKRLSRKVMNGHNYRYASSKNKKYHHEDTNYESSSRRKRIYQRDHHHDHYKSSRRNSRRQHHDYEEDDFCSTCSSSSCSSSFCSSSDEEEVDHGYLCHGRTNQIKKSHHQPLKLSATSTKQNADNLSQLRSSTSIAPEQMVKIMQQQQLIIQQQLAQMQPQLKQQRYLRNNTNESCVIS